MKSTKEERQRRRSTVWSLFREGHTRKEIQRIVGLSYGTVLLYIKDLEREEVKAAKIRREEEDGFMPCGNMEGHTVCYHGHQCHNGPRCDLGIRGRPEILSPEFSVRQGFERILRFRQHYPRVERRVRHGVRRRTQNRHVAYRSEGSCVLVPDRRFRCE